MKVQITNGALKLINSSLLSLSQIITSNLQIWNNYDVITSDDPPDKSKVDAIITEYTGRDNIIDKFRLDGGLVYIVFTDTFQLGVALREFKITLQASNFKYEWERFHEGGLEVTTKGDKRFTPFFMRLYGMALENYYQLRIKGLGALGYTNWKESKGVPPILIRTLTKHVTRKDVENDPEWLYIFTDNLNRTSGSALVPDDCWYRRHFNVIQCCYPSETLAVMRGLPNAYPISTMRTQFRNQIMEVPLNIVRRIWDHEIDLIIEALKSGNYKGIVVPPSRIGKGRYSNLSGDYQDTLDRILLDKLYLENTPNGLVQTYRRGITDPNDIFSCFKSLYLEYFRVNPSMMYELAVLGYLHKVYTDVHAVNENTQARAYAEIMNNLFEL